MSEKKILLLGSGLMAQTVVNHLLKRPENRIIIASNILKSAQQLADVSPNCRAVVVDVTDSKSLTPLVAESDIVISYVPWTFHLYVAKVCLEQKTNLVTASYIQPKLAAMNDDVVKAGVTFLNEVGVDPGIDHIATMKVVDECKEAGDKILEYESFCGGLPSPEFCDNPLGYKFSWSPVGALLSLKNDAVFLKNGKTKHVKSQDLLYSAQKKDINMALSVEGYPNRDSVMYKSLYRLDDCQNLIRGTLRFYGFAFIMNSMKELGLLENEKKVPVDGPWIDLLQQQTRDISQVHPIAQKIVQKMSVSKNVAPLAGKILTKSFQNHNYKGISEKALIERGEIILDAYNKLGFFNIQNRVESSKTYLVNVVSILEKSCALGEGETDMIVMQHKFKILKKNGQINNKKSTLIVIGQKNSYSAMAITVGTPTAISAQLILDGKITRKGVLMPNTKDVYNPILEELVKLGLDCKEQDDIQEGPGPKL